MTDQVTTVTAKDGTFRTKDPTFRIHAERVRPDHLLRAELRITTTGEVLHTWEPDADGYLDAVMPNVPGLTLVSIRDRGGKHIVHTHIRIGGQFDRRLYDQRTGYAVRLQNPTQMIGAGQ